MPLRAWIAHRCATLEAVGADIKDTRSSWAVSPPKSLSTRTEVRTAASSEARRAGTSGVVSSSGSTLWVSWSIGLWCRRLGSRRSWSRTIGLLARVPVVRTAAKEAILAGFVRSILREITSCKDSHAIAYLGIVRSSAAHESRVAGFRCKPFPALWAEIAALNAGNGLWRGVRAELRADLGIRATAVKPIAWASIVLAVLWAFAGLPVAKGSRASCSVFGFCTANEAAAASSNNAILPSTWAEVVALNSENLARYRISLRPGSSRAGSSEERQWQREENGILKHIEF